MATTMSHEGTLVDSLEGMAGGNAGANCAADHVVVLGAAIDQLSPDWHAGHTPGDAPALAAKELLVGTDSAGASHCFAEECRDRNIGFTLGSGSTAGFATPCCWSRKRIGNPPAKPTAAYGTAPRWPRSPIR
ncbi:MAG TPA: hypothetical protein VFZ68_13670 [Acidimicrobiales bacterium]